MRELSLCSAGRLEELGVDFSKVHLLTSGAPFTAESARKVAKITGALTIRYDMWIFEKDKYLSTAKLGDNVLDSICLFVRPSVRPSPVCL